MKKISWLLPALAATLLLSCGSSEKNNTKPSAGKTKAPVVARSPDQQTSSASSGGGGGSGGGALSRAERDREYERVKKEFPQEPSVGKNPVELRAQGKPKTIEDVQNFSGYEEVSTMVPQSTSYEAVESGKEMYVKVCTACHAVDGAPVTDIGNLSAYNMANLSDPLAYKYGADSRGIFRSIAFGVPAPPHGIYKKRLSNAQIWNLTNFVQSIQKEP